MEMLECKVCNFSTFYPSNFRRHLNTKKHKNNEKHQKTYEEEGLKRIKKRPQRDPKETPNPKKNPKKRPQKDPKETPNLGVNEIKKKPFFCENCGIEFSYRTHLYRHLKKSCKKRDEISELKSIIQKNEKEKEKLYDYIEKLIEKTGDTNINIENQTNNQLILNNFGHEDISHISDKFMQKLLSIPYVGVQKLIEKVHFSKKKPENKNIALTNKKEKMIKIFKNNKWKYKSRDEIMDEIINTNYTRIDDYYVEKGKDKMIESHSKRYEEFQEKFEEQEEDLHNKIKNDCEMILLSDNL